MCCCCLPLIPFCSYLESIKRRIEHMPQLFCDDDDVRKILSRNFSITTTCDSIQLGWSKLSNQNFKWQLLYFSLTAIQKHICGWQTFRGHKRWHFVDIRGDISWTFFGDISWTFFGDISWTFFWWHFVDIFGDISWTFLSTKCHLVWWHFVDTFRWHFVDILDDISWTLLSD